MSCRTALGVSRASSRHTGQAAHLVVVGADECGDAPPRQVAAALLGLDDVAPCPHNGGPTSLGRSAAVDEGGRD